MYAVKKKLNVFASRTYYLPFTPWIWGFGRFVVRDARAGHLPAWVSPGKQRCMHPRSWVQPPSWKMPRRAGAGVLRSPRLLSASSWTTQQKGRQSPVQLYWRKLPYFTACYKCWHFPLEQLNCTIISHVLKYKLGQPGSFYSVCHGCTFC